MNILNCVFSYNRYHYLRNTVESLFEFFRFGDTIIIDDGSDSNDVLSYLSMLEERGIEIIKRQRQSDWQLYQYLHGGLYDNMDMAVEIARSRNYEYIHFIQDDVQFMWHDPELPKRVSGIFQAQPDASMVENIFFYGISRAFISDKLEIYPESHCYHRQPHGLLDMGIAQVKTLSAQSFRFGNGIEGTNSAWWRRHGYKSYRLHAPTMVQVPWPKAIRSDQSVAGGFSPPNLYFMKPLTNDQVTQLMSRPLEDVPIAEDYCKPWGWDCPLPYWNRPDNPAEYNRSKLHSWRRTLRPLRTAGRKILPNQLRALIRALFFDD